MFDQGKTLIYLSIRPRVDNRGNVFVFGYDSLVLGILRRARSQGKEFNVYNTEMRPGFNGRKFAGELSQGGVKVTHYADTSLKGAISGADVVLSGCNTILSNGKIPLMSTK